MASTASEFVSTAAETVAPGRAYVAIVSDHGFARTTMQLNLVGEFRRAGLVTVNAGTPTLASIAPNNGLQGQVLNNVAITGTFIGMVLAVQAHRSTPSRARCAPR